MILIICTSLSLDNGNGIYDNNTSFSPSNNYDINDIFTVLSLDITYDIYYMILV